jgi:hypothetical protein
MWQHDLVLDFFHATRNLFIVMSWLPCNGASTVTVKQNAHNYKNYFKGVFIYRQRNFILVLINHIN